MERRGIEALSSSDALGTIHLWLMLFVSIHLQAIVVDALFLCLQVIKGFDSYNLLDFLCLSTQGTSRLLPSAWIPSFPQPSVLGASNAPSLLQSSLHASQTSHAAVAVAQPQPSTNPSGSDTAPTGM